MRPSEGAAGRCQAAGTAEEGQRTDSLAEPAEAGKQAALTRLGEILAAMPKHEGGRPPQKTGSDWEPVSSVPTLADLGIDKKVPVSTGLTQSSFGRVAQ